MKHMMKHIRNKKGISLILMAFMLALLLALAALAIDIGYMYYVKNELQVAADAAALAGAARLTGATDSSSTALAQVTARQEAWRFACRNKAAGSNVYLATNTPENCNATNAPAASALNGSTNSNTGDIIVGHWRSTAPGAITCATGWETLGNGYFCRANGNTGLSINAIKVRPQRTSAGASYGMGPVGIFLGRVLRALPIGAVDWQFMSARAEAIATMPPRANQFIAVCREACTNGATSCTYPNAPCSLTPARQFDSGPCRPGSCADKIAWTSLTTAPTSASAVSGLFCAQSPYQEVCGTSIYTTMGTVASTMRDFESIMFDPLFDSAAKTCLDGSCNSNTDKVTSWTLIVPITQNCPPGGDSTVPIFGYAKIRVIAICAPGGGTACHDPYHAAYVGGNSCDGYGNNVVVVDQIQCISCADASQIIGLKPVLVR